MKFKTWTPNEIAYLRKHYPDGNTAEIALHLDRTVPSVNTKACELDIKKSSSFRSAQMVQAQKIGAEKGSWKGFAKGNTHYLARRDFSTSGRPKAIQQPVKGVTIHRMG